MDCCKLLTTHNCVPDVFVRMTGLKMNVFYQKLFSTQCYYFPSIQRLNLPGEVVRFNAGRMVSNPCIECNYMYSVHTERYRCHLKLKF